MVSVERWVLIAALALSALAWALWRTPHGVSSAAAGGLLAFLNLLLSRRTVAGILWGSRRTRTALSLALVFKMGLLMAAIWAAVRLLGLDPVGVALGFSAIVIGIVGGSVYTPLAGRADRAQPGQ
jgi:fucose permease